MWTMALLVAGNLIGAGMLGLPIKTGPAGLFPSLLIFLVLAGGMFFTAIVLAQEVIKSNNVLFNYPSLYKQYLGQIGHWLAIFTNLLIIYGVLTAYLTGVSAVIKNLLPFSVPSPLIIIVFFAVVTTIAFSSINLVKKFNALIILLIMILFTCIILLTYKNVQYDYLLNKNFFFLPATAPIIATSLMFHNIVPTVCKNLNNKFSNIRKAILIGMFISCSMNIIWLWVVIGSLPLNGSKLSLKMALANNFPATIPLAQIVNSPFFITFSIIFTLLVLVAPYIVVGVGLNHFMEDLLRIHLNSKSKSLNFVLSFAPPLLISIIYPNLFLSALDVAGGIGIVTLFGIMPCVIVLMQKNISSLKKGVGLFFLLIFLVCLIFEIGQELGLIMLDPDIEYWKICF